GRAEVVGGKGGGAGGAGIGIVDGRKKTLSSFFLGGARRRSAPAGTSISKSSTRTWSARLCNMLRVDGAPDFLNMLLPSMVVTKQPPQWVETNSIFKSSTPDFARSMMRRTPS